MGSRVVQRHPSAVDLTRPRLVRMSAKQLPEQLLKVLALQRLQLRRVLLNVGQPGALNILVDQFLFDV